MKKTIAGDYTKIQNYTPHNILAHKRKRRKKVQETAAAVKQYNDKMRAEKLQMIIILNFKGGYLVTLKYSQGSRDLTYKAADDTLMKTLRSIKREYRKTGQEFKYIAVTERGKRCSGVHHHVLVDSMECAAKLARSWKGYTNIEPLEEEGAFKDLAAYICKSDTKEELPKGKSAYHASRNLKQPIIEYSLEPDTWQENPEPPKGYEIVPNSLVNGFNEMIGIKYQSYMLKRQKDPKERQMDHNMKRQRGTLLGNTLRKIFLHRPNGSRTARTSIFK